MTDNHDSAQSNHLPKFSVNVAPTSQIHSRDLHALLARFRRGEIEPLIFGDDDKPEAAVIPFSAFVRLMRHDHAGYLRDEHAVQSELSRRIQESDAARAHGEEPGVLLETDEDLLAWAESLGEVGKEWANEQRVRDERPGHEE